MAKKLVSLVLISFCFSFPVVVWADSPEIAAIPVEQPVTVNGDTVEYLTETNEVNASGKVMVNYQGTLLTCDKLTVNTQTKDAVAEGNVRIEDPKNTLEGEKIIYNFNTKAGTVSGAGFFSSPHFGKAEKINRIDETHFSAVKGYFTTCDFDQPHFRVRSKKIDVYPGDKIQTKKDTLYLGRVPVAYAPFYNHSLQDPFMHVQLAPGYSKEWGPFLLSAWRYNLGGNVKGRIFMDYRERRGFGNGFAANYQNTQIGSGDFKFYYTQERPPNFREDQPGKFERYFARWRHKWNIDEKTNLINEYYKIVDSKRMLLGTDYNILKDYFPREYDQDSLPLSYTQFNHSFSHSTVNVLAQKRTNRWYSETEKLPEIDYSMPNLQIGELPLYFDHLSQAVSFNKKAPAPSPSTADLSLNRLDTTNKLSLPVKVSFIDLTPFVSLRETYYDKDSDGSAIAPRTVFYTGTEASAKFYRLFGINSDFLNLDINDLRHVITPKVSYAYNYDPTIPSGRLKQFDAVDAVSFNNSAVLELSNKLQTKRNNKTVDLVNFVINDTYTFYTRAKKAGFLGDYVFNLEILPYSWLRIDSDALYNHKQDYFSNINYDLNFNLSTDKTISFGQRFQKKGSKESTLGMDWQFTPKWKFHLYERYKMDRLQDRRRLIRQEYGIERDLHCWLFDFTYTIEREHGVTAWCIFKLKAFPEIALDYDTNYNAPKNNN